MMLRPSHVLRVAAARYGKLMMSVLVGAATLAAVLVIGLSPRRAVSLPLYARQTGQTCDKCHTAFYELTPAGRRFKLGGYTQAGGDWAGPPLAVMLHPSFSHTHARQEGGAPPPFLADNHFRLPGGRPFTCAT